MNNIKNRRKFTICVDNAEIFYDKYADTITYYLARNDDILDMNIFNMWGIINTLVNSYE